MGAKKELDGREKGVCRLEQGKKDERARKSRRRMRVTAEDSLSGKGWEQ